MHCSPRPGTVASWKSLPWKGGSAALRHRLHRSAAPQLLAAATVMRRRDVFCGRPCCATRIQDSPDAAARPRLWRCDRNPTGNARGQTRRNFAGRTQDLTPKPTLLSPATRLLANKSCPCHQLSTRTQDACMRARQRYCLWPPALSQLSCKAEEAIISVAMATDRAQRRVMACIAAKQLPTADFGSFPRAAWGDESSLTCPGSSKEHGLTQLQAALICPALPGHMLLEISQLGTHRACATAGVAMVQTWPLDVPGTTLAVACTAAFQRTGAYLCGAH